MSTFSEREMHQLLLKFSQGRTLSCPRCNGNLESRLERGGLLSGQVLGGPTVRHLIVECLREGIVGQTVYGA